jgi:AcrR family transcriptional regulator
MNEVVVLTPERILEVTEDVLRRFGLAKATVVDVARALDVSHGSVYRHFPSKQSLRQAVAKRWLDRVSAPLTRIAESSGPAPARLERWLRALCEAKQKKVLEDPERPV